ncbi:RHS repeat-associated protein [Arthrobacter sp. UYCu512]|uniref:SpvB/TcaC N-terminal domain-containing protein n=1 Tax=Arthrobacter sp. UYCu512 TaxID=3156338 RepID=UPI0033969B1B
MNGPITPALVEVADLLPPFDVAVDASTGSASYSYPLPLPSGRLGFGPGLAFNYQDAAGNSPFGFGWALGGMASVSVFDRRDVPRYDATDRYSLAGDELVPALTSGPGGQTALEWDAPAHHVRRFRSRHESTFTRVEQWTATADGDVHWRVRRPDGSVAIFGRRSDGSGRIRDPERPSRIYEWLLEAQYDRFGNAIRYDYAAEDGAAVDWSSPAEFPRLNPAGHAQRLLKRVRYLNQDPLDANDDGAAANWHLEVVLDYGDHAPGQAATPAPDQDWLVRQDPYSSRRPGFEVRTYRLCRRILVFHRFAALGPAPVLTRAVNLIHDQAPTGTFLHRIEVQGFRHDATVTVQSLPGVTFRYSDSVVEQRLRTLDSASLENLPQGLHGSDYRFADVRGEGLPGVLTVADGAWYYKPNLGGGIFGPQERLAETPSDRTAGSLLADFDRDGNFNVAVLDGRHAGFSEYNRDERSWHAFQPFGQVPVFAGPGRQDWVDVDGDGLPETILALGENSLCFPALGKIGYGAPTNLPQHAATSVPLLAERPEVGVFMADMTGDGLLDLVQVQEGRIEYWPGLPGGDLGDPISMLNPPSLPDGTTLDIRRIRFADLDSTGTADLVYVGADYLLWWRNAAGNGFVSGGQVLGLPAADDLCSAQVLDLLGDGTLSIVWSSVLAGDSSAPLRYVRLMADGPPRRLVSVASDAGAETVVEYSSSAVHYRRDEAGDEPWLTRLPQHVTVVDRVFLIDHIANTRSVARYEYHCGYFDSVERVFRGFLHVDIHDSGSFHRPGWGAPGVAEIRPLRPDELPPDDLGAASCHRLWHASGDPDVDARLRTRCWAADPDAPTPPSGPDAPTEDPDAHRALAGWPLRDELFAVNRTGQRNPQPLSVSTTGYAVHQLQPALGGRPAAYTVRERETLEASYEEQPADPRVEQRVVLARDEVGCELLTLDLGCPRRPGQPAADPSQGVPISQVTRRRVTHVDTEDSYLLAIPVEEEAFEGRGLGDAGPLSFTAARAAATAALAAPLENGAAFTAGMELRRVSWDRTLYRDAARTGTRPLGDPGPEGLVHHEEHACFAAAEVARIYAARVNAAALTAAHYVAADGYWWARGPVAALLPAARFSLPEGSLEADGAQTAWVWDPAALSRLSFTDEVGNTTTADLDYQVMAPWRITDANQATFEARYDAFGFTVLTSGHGTALDDGGTSQAHGARPLSAHPGGLPGTVTAALANPAGAVVQASTFAFCDLAAFRDRGEPICSVDVARESLVDDGAGGPAQNGELKVAVQYFDGFGRPIQGKQRVDAGPAVVRRPDGSIDVDAQGVPVEAPAAQRWRASGHVVFDSKQQAVLEFEPFHTTTPRYEPDPELQSFGTAVRHRYDALGREIGVSLPNGTRTQVTTDAWSTTSADPNDTVTGSDYELQRQALPAGDPERRALERARAHAGTPTTVHVDPMGRTVLEVRRGAAAEERRCRRTLDDDGNVTAVVDARGVMITQVDLDMAGRLLRQRSVDAGETVFFLDALDREVQRWDPRAYRIQSSYDAAGRPTEIRVSGNGLNHMVERLTYGEDPAVPQAVARNARGLLVVHEDSAGRHEALRFTPDGNPLEVSHRLRTVVDREPDWAAPGGEPLDATTYTAVSAYDAFSRPLRRTSPDGTTRMFKYRRAGGMDTITVSTSDGQLSNRSILAGSSANARGQQERVELGNGVTTINGYDRATGQLTRSTTASAGAAAQTLRDVEVVRDPAGNITWLLDHAQEPAHPTPVLQGLTVTPAREYRYDPYYQVVEATGRVHQALLPTDAWSGAAGVVQGTRHLSLANGAAVERFTQRFHYDVAGNLDQIKHTGTTRSWTQDIWVSATSNRRLPALDTNGVPIAAPEGRFDAAGNTNSLPHLAAIVWDHRNRLRSATIIDRSAQGQPNDVEHYAYDADGRRVRKVTERLTAGGLERTEKIYLEGCELFLHTRAGITAIQRTVALIEDDDRCLATVYRWSADTSAAETDTVGTAEVRFLIPDDLGSTAMELDSNGVVLSYEEHFSYGGSCFIAGAALRRTKLRDRRYTGKERDDATGLYYFGYRYYASWIGGWLSPDPLGNAASLNLYEFVQNNPVNLVDPNGLQATGTMSRLDSVPANYTGAQAMRHFNNGRGRELGIRALEVKRSGNNWMIVRQENYTPRLQQMIAENGGNVEKAGALYDIEKMFDELKLDEPAVPASDAPASDAPAGDPPTTPAPPATGAGNGGGATSAQTAPTGDRATGNAHSADGSNSSKDGGSGTATQPGAPGSTGSGSGTKGTGPGGGGMGEAATGPSAGPGNGNGPGTGPGTDTGPGNGKTPTEPGGTGGGTTPGTGGGKAGGSGTGGKGTSPGGAQGGVDGGTEGGAPGGQVGGNVNGSPTGSVDGKLDGNTTGDGTTPAEGGSPTGSADGTADGGATGQGDGPSKDPTKHGTEKSGPGGGTGTGTKTGDSEPADTGTGTGTSGSGPAGSNQEPTTLDKITKIAGYWHLEFSGSADGVSGGIPGGMGFLSGWGAQVAFLALTVVDIVLTVLTLGEFKAAMVGLKNALKAGMTSLKGVVSRGLRGMGTALLGLFRRAAPGQRTPLLRRLGRFFWEDRRSFGMWKDFRRRWSIAKGSGWSMEHMIIKQRWYRTVGKKPPFFRYGTRMNRIMQGLGDAGWNVVPIKGWFNTWLYNNKAVSAVFNYGTYAGGGYGLYKLWDYALEPLRDPPGTAPAPAPAAAP